MGLVLLTGVVSGPRSRPSFCRSEPVVAARARLCRDRSIDSFGVLSRASGADAVHCPRACVLRSSGHPSRETGATKRRTCSRFRSFGFTSPFVGVVAFETVRCVPFRSALRAASARLGLKAPP